MKEYIKMLFMGSVILAPILSNKILALGSFTLPGGMLIAVVLMYGLIDLMNYRYGQQEARKMLVQALVVRLFLYLAIVPVILALPGTAKAVGFTSILAQSFKLMIAGEISVFVSQYFFDVPIFNYFKRFPFVARVMASDLVSQALQTVGFVLIGFMGQNVPHFKMIVSAYVMRIIFSAVKALIFYPGAVIKREGTTS